MSATTARAVVVSALEQSVTTVAPGDDPGWSNMAYRGTASAVYLGNRWAISANHVGDGSLRFTDGRTFESVPGSAVQLSNTGPFPFGNPDLVMFRTVEDPGLPSLEIGTATPSGGSNLMMIGAGLDRTPGLLGWSAPPFVGAWTPVVLPLANAFGYSLATTKTMRWGTNTATGGTTTINSTTLGFSTRFDRRGQTFEAQVAAGDSGGGAFQFVDDSWKLVGIMIASDLLPNQPSGTAVYGNGSLIADLSMYRPQIEDLLARVDPAWQNPRNYFDVDGSGFVSPLDAALVINKLLRSGVEELVGAPPPGSPLYDVNGDDLISSLDAIRLINALLNDTANTAAPASSVQPNVALVPEPSTSLLALLAAVSIAAARCIAIARRRSA